MVRVNIHIDADSLSYPKSPQSPGRNVPRANSEIDNKNRADITCRPGRQKLSVQAGDDVLLVERLRRQLADQRRPVGERRAYARPMAGAPACTEQIVSGSAHEVRAAPVGVVTRVGDVLAGDPDRVAVHGGCANRP